MSPIPVVERLDPFALSHAFAEIAADCPRPYIERLLASLDGPTIFEQLVDELGPHEYVEGRPTL